ncbi:MAG: DJ-1/PfpI family protein [Clostridia bacterium]|nr:DJ-1/PfpI family protein [Clostridia bacterium]
MICLFLANGFEETEAICPLDLMKRGGIDVKTVAVGTQDAVVTSTRGVRVIADMTLEQLDPALIEGMVLPGGLPGADNLNIPEIHQLLKRCNEQGGLIAAICAAPYVLGGQGILENKNAVCYPGFEEKLLGAKISKEPVVRDGNVITAVGMGASVAFGLALVEYLKGKEVAAQIARAIFA